MQLQSFEHALPSSIGTYAVVTLLGVGGMGDVFLAVPRCASAIPKLFTVKCLRTEFAPDHVARTTFIAEANLAARFAHPNLVSTLEVGQTVDGTPFIVMDYREGQSLARIARHAHRARLSVPHEMWALVVARALRGLHYAHELTDYDGSPLDVVHRDVSPDNVIVGYDGQVTLIDFGVARVAAHLSHSDVGIMKGKIGYMAPEYIDEETVDRRSDVFSMGVVLWELLAEESLSAYGGGRCAPHFLTSKPLPRVSTVIPSIDPALDDLVAHALERDPKRRFITAKAMREALEQWLSTRPAFTEEQAGRWVAHLFEAERADIAGKVQRRLADARPGAAR